MERGFVLGIFVWLSASVLAFALADLVRTATVAAGSQGRLNCRVSRADGCVDFVLFAFRVASFAASLVVMAIKIFARSELGDRRHRVLVPVLLP